MEESIRSGLCGAFIFQAATVCFSVQLYRKSLMLTSSCGLFIYLGTLTCAIPSLMANSVTPYLKPHVIRSNSEFSLLCDRSSLVGRSSR
ncbi:hypothetical protein J3F83DRAFT_723650 [Trichoderma novae-zelandiae]